MKLWHGLVAIGVVVLGMILLQRRASAASLPAGAGGAPASGWPTATPAGGAYVGQLLGEDGSQRDYWKAAPVTDGRSVWTPGATNASGDPMAPPAQKTYVDQLPAWRGVAPGSLPAGGELSHGPRPTTPTGGLYQLPAASWATTTPASAGFAPTTPRPTTPTALYALPKPAGNLASPTSFTTVVARPAPPPPPPAPGAGVIRGVAPTAPVANWTTRN